MAAIVAMVTFVFGVASSGGSYLWCSAMQRAMSACCCPRPDVDVAPSEGPSIARRCCCEERSAEATPIAAAAGPTKLVVSQAMTALTAAPQPPLPTSDAPSARLAPVVPQSAAPCARAGPSSGAERCLVLRVIRC